MLISQAIDFCPQSSINIIDTDIDLETRGIDRPEDDLFGVFDAGADELQEAIPDLIFNNGFER